MLAPVGGGSNRRHHPQIVFDAARARLMRDHSAGPPRVKREMTIPGR